MVLEKSLQLVGKIWEFRLTPHIGEIRNTKNMNAEVLRCLQKCLLLWRGVGGGGREGFLMSRLVSFFY